MDKFNFISLLHKLYQLDVFVNDIFSAVAIVVNKVLSAINALKCELFFDTMVFMLPVYEYFMKIYPSSTQSLDDRRAVVQAHWCSTGHNDITLLQNVANVWKNGETVVTFVAGQIVITFVGAFGIPADLNSLLTAMDIVKPAHLPYLLHYKWLLIKDIHNVKTIDEMQALTISQFARGSY